MCVVSSTKNVSERSKASHVISMNLILLIAIMFCSVSSSHLGDVNEIKYTKTHYQPCSTKHTEGMAY
jgi:molybdate-binding protein